MFKVVYIFLSLFAFLNAQSCLPSITTASGTAAPGEICSGSLIFEENFDTLDKSIWQPEGEFIEKLFQILVELKYKLLDAQKIIINVTILFFSIFFFV